MNKYITGEVEVLIERLENIYLGSKIDLSIHYVKEYKNLCISLITNKPKNFEYLLKVKFSAELTPPEITKLIIKNLKFLIDPPTINSYWDFIDYKESIFTTEIFKLTLNLYQNNIDSVEDSTILYNETISKLLV